VWKISYAPVSLGSIGYANDQVSQPLFREAAQDGSQQKGFSLSFSEAFLPGKDDE
jgi:hypothetical protein